MYAMCLHNEPVTATTIANTVTAVLTHRNKRNQTLTFYTNGLRMSKMAAITANERDQARVIDGKGRFSIHHLLIVQNCDKNC